MHLAQYGGSSVSVEHSNQYARIQACHLSHQLTHSSFYFLKYFLLLSFFFFFSFSPLPSSPSPRLPVMGAFRGFWSRDSSWLVAGSPADRKASSTDWAAFDGTWAMWRVQIRGPLHVVGPLNTTGLTALSSVHTTLTSGFGIWITCQGYFFK